MDLLSFMVENKKSGGLTKEISDRVEELFKKYKLDKSEDGCSIICADFGNLGSIEIKEVEEFEEPVDFKYAGGSYDFITVKTKSIKNILWTDYENIEPYNRQGGLYANGCSFSRLGKPVLEKKEYREFVSSGDYKINISFAVWGFDYNEFYGSVRFGLCIKSENVDTFISELRKIIDK